MDTCDTLPRVDALHNLHPHTCHQVTLLTHVFCFQVRWCQEPGHEAVPLPTLPTGGCPRAIEAGHVRHVAAAEAGWTTRGDEVRVFEVTRWLRGRDTPVSTSLTGTAWGRVEARLSHQPPTVITASSPWPSILSRVSTRARPSWALVTTSSTTRTTPRFWWPVLTASRPSRWGCRAPPPWRETTCPHPPSPYWPQPRGRRRRSSWSSRGTGRRPKKVIPEPILQLLTIPSENVSNQFQSNI